MTNLRCPWSNIRPPPNGPPRLLPRPGQPPQNVPVSNPQFSGRPANAQAKPGPHLLPIPPPGPNLHSRIDSPPSRRIEPARRQSAPQIVLAIYRQRRSYIGRYIGARGWEANGACILPLRGLMALPAYNPVLLALATAVAIVGAYASVEIGRRVRFHEGRRRQRWAYFGALALALTVWAADVTGTLALSRFPVWLDTLLVISSFIAALVAGGAVFFDVHRTERNTPMRVGSIVVAIAAVGGVQHAILMSIRTSLAAADAGEVLLSGTFQLGLIISIISILLLAAAVAATRFERWTITTRTRFESLLELAPQ